MKKQQLFFAIIIFFSACSTNTFEEKFEKNLLAPDLAVIEKWEHFYYDFLKENYKETDYESGTKKFLKHIYDYEKTLLKYSEQEICSLLKEYENSTLYYKVKRLEYDTIYEAIEGSEVIVAINQEGEISLLETFGGKDVREIEEGKTTKIFIEDSLILETENEYLSEILLPPGRTIQDKIKSIKDRGYNVFIHESSFVNSLRFLCEQSINAEEYVYVKDRSGEIQLSHMCNYLLHDEDVDFDDYIVRKIIIFEVVIKYFGIINTC